MKIYKTEASGKGINTIVEKYGADVFEFSETHLTIRIPYNKNILKSMSDTSNVHQNVHQNVHKKSDMDRIINLIRENENTTLKEMALEIGKSVKTVQRIIREYGKIIFVGSSKSGHWEIKE